jgi:predicted ATPase
MIHSNERNGDTSYMPEVLRLKGNLLLSMPHPNGDAAEMYFLQSLKWSRRQGARAWELRTAVDLAEWLVTKARPDDARALLRPIFEQFVGNSNNSDLNAAEHLLGALQ